MEIGGVGGRGKTMCSGNLRYDYLVSVVNSNRVSSCKHFYVCKCVARS